MSAQKDDVMISSRKANVCYYALLTYVVLEYV